MFINPNPKKRLLLLVVLFLFALVGFSQQIAVYGGSASGPSIDDGDISPSISDYTDFDTNRSSTFFIDNLAGARLENITITLSNTSAFEISEPLARDRINRNRPPRPFTISVLPGVQGTVTSLVTIESNANNDGSDNAWTFTIQATNEPEIEVTGNSFSIADGDITPSEVDFTDFGPNVSRTFRIRNSSTRNSRLEDLSISLSNNTDFEITNPLPVNAINRGNAPQPFTISLRNGSVSTLTTTEVSIQSNAVNAGPDKTWKFTVQAKPGDQQIAVLGNGVSIADRDTIPSTADFTDFGTNLSRVFQVSNIQQQGSTTLTISSITLSNTTDFEISTPLTDTTISKNQIVPFTISVKGSSCGTVTSTVTIASDADNDGTDNVWTFTISANKIPEINITGNGVDIADGDPTPTVTDHRDFGSVDIGNIQPRTFTIENLGTCDLSLYSITNTNNTEFVISELTTPSSISGGSLTTFTVTFSPTAGGVRTANIIIRNSDSDEPTYSLYVQGIGNAPLTEGPGGVVSNLQLWLKSTEGLGYSDGDPVSVWATQGRGSNATVNTTGQEPTYYDNPTNNVNFNPVILFDNDRTAFTDPEFDYTVTPQEFLEGSSGFYTQEIFIVALPNDVITSSYESVDLFCGDSPNVDSNDTDGTGIGYGAYTVRFSGEVLTYAIGTSNSTETNPDNKGYGIANKNSTFTGPSIINVRDNTNVPVNGSEMYYNGLNIVEEEVGVPQFINVEDSRFWIGRSQGYRATFAGRIAEVITYSSRKDDTTERNKIESYLALKYGITLADNGLGTTKDYVDSDGTTIWDYDTGVPGDDAFNFDIAGIGRDDVAELNQKQSRTINTTDDITIGLGEISATNSANPNSFSTDKSFLVWGNNRGSLNAQSVIDVDMSDGITGLSTMVDFTPIGRIWKVTKQGNTGVSKIALPQSMLTNVEDPAGGEYYMFLSDTPSFSPTSEYKKMSVNGSNLETSYEFTSSTKYITFGFAPERTFTRSIQFDGSDDYLDGGDVLDINPTSFTISAWINRANSNGSIVSKRDNLFTSGYDFKINASGHVEMSWNNGSTQTITSSVSIPSNQWHHVAVTYDGSSARLYIDGVQDGSAVSLSQPTNSSESFLIAAADGVNTTSFFQGNIDEVRIWDIALTTSQLRYLINQEIEKNSTTISGAYFNNLGVTPTNSEVESINWTNLKGYFPMSTYMYTNVKDASENGNTVAVKNLNTVDYQTAPLPYISASNGDWDTATTWLHNTVQTIPNSTSIVDGTTPIDWNIVEIADNTSVTSGNRDIKVLGLHIVSTTSDGTDTKLTITGSNATVTGNKLEVSHYLKIDGILDLNGESQLIQPTNSDFDASSTGYLERDQQGVGNKFRYNIWSSPVFSANDGNNYATLNDVLFDATDPNNPITPNYTSGYNGSLGTPITISTYWMYKYANLTGTYSEWTQIGNTGKLYSGEAFILKGSGDPGASEQNYAFRGKPNNGTIQLNVSGGYSYLIGNPYPSAIDANQFISDNSPSGTGSLGNGGALYFWEHYGGDSHNLKDYQGGYATYSLAGGVIAASHPNVSQDGTATKTPQRYIPVGQGFFVVGDADGGILEFNNNQREFVTESNSSVSIFMKQPNSKNTTPKEEDTRLKIKLGFEAPKISHRQLLLTIDENTTDKVDWGYDALLYEEFEDDMFWMLDEQKYTIQATNTITKEKEFPIGIVTKEGGVIKIVVDEISNAPEELELFIKDNLSGSIKSLVNGEVEIELEAGEYLDRFALVFKDNVKEIAAIEESFSNEIITFMNNSTSEINIKNYSSVAIQNISVFNYVGQLIQSWNTNLDKKELSLPIKTSPGIYILQVKTNERTISKKILIE